MDAVLERGLSDGALEEEGLVGEFQRVAVPEVDLELRRAGLVGHRADVDARGLAIGVDVLDHGVELVRRLDAVGLAAGLLAPRQPRRRCQRQVGVDALLDEIELQLRGDDRLQPALGITFQHTFKDGARCEVDRCPVVVHRVAYHLRGRLVIPGHQPHGRHVRYGADVLVDLGGDLGVVDGIPGHRLDEDRLG